jgi:hypothetical protein
MGDVGALNGRGGKPELLYQIEDAAEGGNHRNQAECLGRQQAGEDDHGAELDNDLNALGAESDDAAANRMPPDICYQIVGAQVLIMIRHWPHWVVGMASSARNTSDR